MSVTLVKAATVGTVAEPATTSSRETDTLSPYHVVLLNDDDHSAPYVIRMLKELFGYSRQKGLRMAKEVHTTGRAIVVTTNLEEAELKQEQVQSFGPDPLVPSCKGSMSAEVEQAS